MLGGGCGDAIAQWVVKGRPDLDMFGYDVRRWASFTYVSFDIHRPFCTGRITNIIHAVLSIAQPPLFFCYLIFYSCRFHPPMFKDKQWVKERSQEAYVKNYSIVYPHDEPLAARNRRKSALHEVRSKSISWIFFYTDILFNSAYVILTNNIQIIDKIYDCVHILLAGFGKTRMRLPGATWVGASWMVWYEPSTCAGIWLVRWRSDQMRLYWI